MQCYFMSDAPQGGQTILVYGFLAPMARRTPEPGTARDWYTCRWMSERIEGSAEQGIAYWEPLYIDDMWVLRPTAWMHKLPAPGKRKRWSVKGRRRNTLSGPSTLWPTPQAGQR